MKKTISHSTQTALVLIVLIITLALASLLWILCKTDTDKQITADIYQNGVLLQSISLDNVTEAYTFTVTGENGCRNEIEVRPGSIGIVSADCPDKLCVHQGFISSSLLPITCLPNRLVIQIRADGWDTNKAPELDIISY